MEQWTYANHDGKYSETMVEWAYKMQRRGTITVGLSGLRKTPESRPIVYIESNGKKWSCDNRNSTTGGKKCCSGKSNTEIGKRTMLRQTLQNLLNFIEKLTGKNYLKVK